MDTELEKLNEIEDLLTSAGYTLSDMVKLFGQHNSKMLMLDSLNYTKFAELYEKLEKGRLTKREKGKLLEDITALLFEKSVANFFEVFRNCRTSTNEIDLLIRWTDNARLSNIHTSFPCFGESFLCECKNYNEKVTVTYVGKFCSLLLVTGSNLGVMVSWKGVTSRGSWSDSAGLIKKIALKEDKYIIVIDKNDLKRIYNKEASIFSIIYEKYIALKNEVDYGKYILKHEAEQYLTNKKES